MKVLAVLVEPANYTLDRVKAVYGPRNVATIYCRGASAASGERVAATRGTWGECRRLLREFDAFVVNSYSEPLCVKLLVLNALFFRKPMAIESDSQDRPPRSLLRRLAKRLWLGTLFRRRWCWGFPPGRFAHTRLFTRYGMPQDRILVMPMVVDNARYARTDVPPPHQPFRFGYIGRLVRHKCVDVLVGALDELVADGVSAELTVVGEGPERPALEARTAERGLEGRVRLAGVLFGGEKIAALHAMDCLVLPSSYEPWGLVVNEALASGIPVIVSEEAGCRGELVEPADGLAATGLVVPGGDTAALAVAMRRMATDRAAHAAFAAAAAKRMEKWNYARYAQCFDAWLRKLVVSA